MDRLKYTNWAHTRTILASCMKYLSPIGPAVLLSFILFFSPLCVNAQSKPSVQSDETIKTLVEAYKTDPRGPYKDIRWFCKDGSTIPAQQRCPEPGIQRARYKDQVVALGASNHIFLGQILAGTDQDAFWDAAEGNSRLKQYQLERWLRQIDNGWINEKANAYRGAYQAEDEDDWGLEFLQWLVSDKNRIEPHFFLIRQAVKDIPHKADENLSQRIRTVSKDVADAVPSFMNLRVKIHGQPDIQDAARVKAYKSENASKLSPEVLAKLDGLIADLQSLFSAANADDILARINKLPSTSTLRQNLTKWLAEFHAEKDPINQAFILADASRSIRTGLVFETRPSVRLALLDLSSKLEELLIGNLSTWEATTLEEELDRIELLTSAATGFGFLEIWEYDRAMRDLIRLRSVEPMPLVSLNKYLDASRRIVEWGSMMVHATYEEVVELYAGFEPKANGFYDEKIRSSVLLHMGASVGQLGDFFAREAGFSNQMLNIKNQAQARGLNPGYALGELVVVPGVPESVTIDASKIYVFNRPPADLKPVSGILTVTEGNMVSHVQLLARNLGIPNGVVSASNQQDMMAYSGKKVFLAVSNTGTIIMKLASEMTPQESALFAQKERDEGKITVPVSRMNLNETRVLNLSNVNATHSGILTGPKAANLGQLKLMFPDHVVDGLVIPFGIFRQHMNLPMPGQNMSYWQFLTESFKEGEKQRKSGKSEAEVEAYLLTQLATLRGAILKLTLNPEFVRDLKQSFRTILGGEIGKIPVFLRSDTNMEDLKDFTGAGLNLTLFNVLDEQRILQGVKDVWGSAYTERSFKWRQRFLLNPENVFPSILIIPSVDADYSGVLITKGLGGGDETDATIAFSRGVGGAVDGQAAESWLIKANGRYQLMTPARESRYTAIPATGGTVKPTTSFNDRILSEANLANLRTLKDTLIKQLPKNAGTESMGALDVELGFKNNKIWLFQVRPFVENRQALSSGYLQSISPSVSTTKKIKLSSKL